MLPILAALAPGLMEGAMRLLDKVIPDPEAREKAKMELVKLEGQQALSEMQVSLSAILEEARSQDPYTSRARPSFLYVMYIYILAAIPFAVVYIFAPSAAGRLTEGMNAFLAAIPDQLYWLFGAGYLGYTGARSFDKWRTNRK